MKSKESEKRRHGYDENYTDLITNKGSELYHIIKAIDEIVSVLNGVKHKNPVLRCSLTMQDELTTLLSVQTSNKFVNFLNNLTNGQLLQKIMLG